MPKTSHHMIKYMFTKRKIFDRIILLTRGNYYG